MSYPHELPADEFPYARITEFLDRAESDPAEAARSLLRDPTYRRVASRDRPTVWSAIFFAMRQTWPSEAAVAIATQEIIAELPGRVRFGLSARLG